jgi:hypothetical protein
VNFAAANLENLARLQVRSSAVHVNRIDSGNAFDLDVMHRAAMLENRERLNQALLLIH